MNSPARKKFWAMIEMNTPFRLGCAGSVTKYKYAVQGEEVKLLKQRGFVHHMNGAWHVHELVSGGLMCTGSSKDQATKDARELIKITPDFGAQIKTLGVAANHEEMTYEQAAKKLGKSKEPNPAEMLRT